MLVLDRLVLRGATIVAAAAMLLVGSPARGASVTKAIAGDGVLGDFTGSVTYTYTAGNTADLAIFLKNVSDPANGGYLTGFVFNIGADHVTAKLNPNPTEIDYNDRDGLDLPKSGFFYDVGTNASASPYGTFEAGAALSSGKPDKNGVPPLGEFLGSGKPQYGIGVGESATFHFKVVGCPDVLDDLSAMAFLREMSGHGDYSASFIARFRGFANGGSNKTPGYSAIPLPPAAWSGCALFGLLMVRGIKRWHRPVA
jgi:hypothetical protein